MKVKLFYNELSILIWKYTTFNSPKLYMVANYVHTYIANTKPTNKDHFQSNDT